jgi:hypothetical protein
LSVLDGAPVLAAGAVVLVAGAVVLPGEVPPAAAAPLLPEREPLVPAAGPGFFDLSEPPTSRGPVVAVGCLSDRTPAAGLAVRSYSLHSWREIWPSLFLSIEEKLGVAAVLLEV